MNLESTNKNQISTPLVSIIVITYNSAQYVIETLESAKAQTYENIELIISDDCSNDNTVEICKTWIERNKESFVRTKIVIGRANTGTTANCNRGVTFSKGDWIKLIAGDDILLTDCIINNLNYAIKNGYKFIFSDMIWFNDHTIIRSKDNQAKLRKQFIETESKFQLHFYSRHPVFLNSPTWFISKTIFKIILFDETFRILEDQPFVLSYLENGGSISYLNLETIKYRKHNDSVQFVKSPNFIKDFQLCFDKYRKKNLKYSSIIDLLYIIKFETFMFGMTNQNVKVKKYIASILTRINPINIFKVNPNFFARSR